MRDSFREADSLLMQEVRHPTASVSWFMERPGDMLRVRGTFNGWHALDHPWGAKMEAHHVQSVQSYLVPGLWYLIWNILTYTHSDLQTLSELLSILMYITMGLSEPLFHFNSEEHLVLSLFTVVYWQIFPQTKSFITHIGEHRIIIV